MQIDELVGRVKEFIDFFHETGSGQFSEDDTVERLSGSNEIEEACMITALYALTLNDSRFDQWRWEFVNEMH